MTIRSYPLQFTQNVTRVNRSEVKRSGSERSEADWSREKRSEAERGWKDSSMCSGWTVDTERSGEKRSPPQELAAKPLVTNNIEKVFYFLEV